MILSDKKSNFGPFQPIFPPETIKIVLYYSKQNVPFTKIHIIIIMIVNLPPHSASSLVVVVVITLLPSEAIQLRSLMGQVEPRNTFICSI